MNAKQAIVRTEGLGMKLWQEALRIEKLHQIADELADLSGDIVIKYDDQFQRKNAAQREAAANLRKLSFSLTEIDGQLQELAWSLDEIVSNLEKLLPPPRVEKLYNPPDAWK